MVAPGPCRSAAPRSKETFTSGNVTPLHEVAAGTGITGDTLRWRWPRIRSAGVLAGPPVPDPSVANFFTIRLSPGRPSNIPGDAFNVGDTVFLRQRPLYKASQANPPTLTPALQSPPLGGHLGRRPPGAGALAKRVAQSRRFLGHRLRRADPVQPGSGRRVRGRRARSIRRDDVAVHPGAHNLQRPAAKCAPVPNPAQPWVCTPPADEGYIAAQQARNLPAAASFPGGRLPAIPSRIIGAYEGGATFSCGVYHPAGACIMRAPLASGNERGITSFDKGDVHGFCAVCRYLIVDRVDPRLHWLMTLFITIIRSHQRLVRNAGDDRAPPGPGGTAAAIRRRRCRLVQAFHVPDGLDRSVASAGLCGARVADRRHRERVDRSSRRRRAMPGLRKRWVCWRKSAPSIRP